MTRTITLSGAEAKLDELGGLYACIYNGGAGTVYASAKPDIVIDADGVTPIAAGGSAIIECNGTVYLLGTGSVTAVGSSDPINFFKPAPVGGGGTGDVSKEYVDAQDATYLSQAKKYAEGIVSNPNLLIDPDFTINQRGLTEYTAVGYTVDGWKLTTAGESVAPLEGGGIRFANTEETPTSTKTLSQYIENYADYRGKTLTLSVTADVVDAVCSIGIDDGVSVVGARITDGVAQATAQISENATILRVIIQLSAASTGYADVHNVKLELGSVATPFVPPDPAIELMRCQRYYYRIGSASEDTLVWGVAVLSSPTHINIVQPTPVPMRVKPTVSGLEDCVIVDDAVSAEYAYADFAQIVMQDESNYRTTLSVRCGGSLTGANAYIKIPAGKYIEFNASP